MKAAESDQPKKAKTNKLNPWAGTPMQLGLEKKFGTKVSIKGSKEHVASKSSSNPKMT